MNNNSNFNSAITPEEIKRQIDIATVFDRYGIKYDRNTKCNILATWRGDEDASVSVDFDRNIWCDHGVGVGAVGRGGSVIDLVAVLERCSFSQACEKLHKMDLTSFFTAPIPHRVADRRIYIEEVKDLFWFPLKKYLFDRGLDERVFHLVKEIHYRNGDNKTIYKSIGFRQTDNEGWVLRSGGGKNGKGFKGCTKQGTTHLSFHRGNKLVVFEGFIDLLTYYMVYGESVDYLCLNSVTNAHKVSSALSRYNDIELWVDNDRAGDEAIKTLRSLDTNKDMRDMRHKFEDYKDLNDLWVGRKEVKNAAS